MQKRFTEEQIIGILREAEADGAVIREFCRKLKDLESGNSWLKKIVAKQRLAIEGLKEIAAKKW